MKVEILDLYDRLRRGDLIWPFGDADVGVIVTDGKRRASVGCYYGGESEAIRMALDRLR